MQALEACLPSAGGRCSCDSAASPRMGSSMRSSGCGRSSRSETRRPGTRTQFDAVLHPSWIVFETWARGPHAADRRLLASTPRLCLRAVRWCRPRCRRRRMPRLLTFLAARRRARTRCAPWATHVSAARHPLRGAPAARSACCARRRGRLTLHRRRRLFSLHQAGAQGCGAVVALRGAPRRPGWLLGARAGAGSVEAICGLARCSIDARRTADGAV